ncbi:hypothetical protein R3P38DRAFT_2870878, partial [Favolaschia claudopus]
MYPQTLRLQRFAHFSPVPKISWLVWNAEIEVLDRALTELREKREALKQPIDAHRALISPIRLLPLDILAEIFLACLPSKREALIDESKAPLLLGRICRHWRAVAYSTPTLWSSIHIPWEFDCPPAILTRLETIVEAWLRRSAACSLSVSLAVPSHAADVADDSEGQKLILRLLSVSDRLRHLGLSGDPQLLRPFLQLGQQDLPRLRSIAINCLNSLISSGDAFSVEPLQVSTLEHVSLIARNVDPLTLPINWSHLTRLRLECEGGRGINGGLEGGRPTWSSAAYKYITIQQWSELKPFHRPPPSYCPTFVLSPSPM